MRQNNAVVFGAPNAMQPVGCVGHRLLFFIKLREILLSDGKNWD
jgi:hypothetical protein